MFSIFEAEIRGILTGLAENFRLPKNAKFRKILFWVLKKKFSVFTIVKLILKEEQQQNIVLLFVEVESILNVRLLDTDRAHLERIDTASLNGRPLVGRQPALIHRIRRSLILYADEAQRPAECRGFSASLSDSTADFIQKQEDI